MNIVHIFPNRCDGPRPVALCGVDRNLNHMALARPGEERCVVCLLLLRGINTTDATLPTYTNGQDDFPGRVKRIVPGEYTLLSREIRVAA
jgi:hypothetical protein